MVYLSLSFIPNHDSLCRTDPSITLLVLKANTCRPLNLLFFKLIFFVIAFEGFEGMILLKLWSKKCFNSKLYQRKRLIQLKILFFFNDLGIWHSHPPNVPIHSAGINPNFIKDFYSPGKRTWFFFIFKTLYWNYIKLT